MAMEKDREAAIVSWSFAPGEPGLLGRAAALRVPSVIQDLPEFLEV